MHSQNSPLTPAKLYVAGSAAILAGVAQLARPALVLAQITNPVIGTLGNDPEEATSGALFLRYFVMLWRSAISIGAILVLLYFIWGSIDWIAAGGDSGKLEKARSKMTQSALGLVVLVSSFTIIAFFGQVMFGGEFNILQLALPSALLESQL